MSILPGYNLHPSLIECWWYPLSMNIIKVSSESHRFYCYSFSIRRRINLPVRKLTFDFYMKSFLIWDLQKSSTLKQTVIKFIWTHNYFWFFKREKSNKPLNNICCTSSSLIFVLISVFKSKSLMFYWSICR